MAERYLIDTCAVSKYLTSVFPSKGIAFMDGIVDQECIISIISEIELKIWEPSDANVLAAIGVFITSSNIIPLEPLVVQKTIEVRKNYKLKIPDAIIASTALVHDLTLISDNDSDFTKIPGLKYINPKTIV